MVVSMGLHSGINASHEYSMVQYSELTGHRSVPLGNGSDDHAAYVAQRYRAIQSGMSSFTRKKFAVKKCLDHRHSICRLFLSFVCHAKHPNRSPFSIDILII